MAILAIVKSFESKEESLFRQNKLLHKPDVHAGIWGEFRVEARTKHIALPYGNNITRRAVDIRLRDASLGLVDSVGKGSDYCNFAICVGRVGVEDLFDNRCANKDALERIAFQKWQIDGSNEALDLAAKVVAVDANVEATNEFLAALFGGVCLFGEDDEAGAGAPDGFLLDS